MAITAQIEAVASSTASSDGVRETDTQTFFMPWADRFAFMDATLPHTTQAGADVTFHPGAEHPDRPGVRAKSMTIEGIAPDTPGTTAGFKVAKVVVTYETASLTTGAVPGAVGIERTEEGDAHLEVVQVSGFGYRWDTDNKELDETEENPEVGITIPTINLRITESNLSSLPWISINALLGHVNNATFLGADVGKVLYLGPSFRGVTAAPVAGQPTQPTKWTASHGFRIRGIPHNYFLRKNVGWEKIYSGSIASKQFLYPESDLSPLLALGGTFNPG